MEWIKTLVSNNTFVFFFCVIGIPMITMGLTEIVKQLIKHRERMAMIEHGMDPYAHEPRKSGKKSSSGPSSNSATTTHEAATESVK